MPAPSTGRDLHVDVPLTQFVLGRRPEGFIADQLLPVTNVSKRSDVYYKFNHLEWFRHEDGDNTTLRAPATKSKKVHMTVGSDAYYANNYALGTDWPVEDEVNADEVLQWAQSNAAFLSDRLLMDYEMRVANLVTLSASVGSIYVASSGWNSPGRTALTDLLTWRDQFKDATGKMPNTIIIPRKVMTKLRLNDQIRDILFGDRGGTATAAQIAGILDIPNVLLPTAQVNTAVEADPQTGGFNDMWEGNGNLWMAHVQTMAGMFTDTWLNSFRWTSPLLGTPWAIKRFPFDAQRKVFTIEAEYYQVEKIISSDLAIRVSSLTAT